MNEKCFLNSLHPILKITTHIPITPDHLPPNPTLKYIKLYIAGFSNSRHDGIAQGEQKHLGLLDDRMVEMPEDQNIHIHLFCQIAQAIRMI